MSLRWCLAAMLGLSLAACLEAPPAADPDGRIDLVVRAGMVTEDLNSYPLLVQLQGNGELVAGPRADATDLSFVDAGGTVLPFEIESWDREAGDLRAWVSIPTLFAAEDTGLSLLYGDDPGLIPNPADVWFEFDGVWHMSTATDSTLWSLQGELVRAELGEGFIGEGLAADQGYFVVDVDSGDDHLDYGGGDSFSISAWLRRDDVTGTYQTFLSKGGTSTNASGYSFETDPPADELFACLSDADEYSCANPGAALSEDEWSLYTLVADRQDNGFYLYVNGGVVSTFGAFNNLQPEQDNDYPLVLGADQDMQHAMIGAIDEVRIVRRTLSQSWILADVVSQSAPDVFVEVVK